MDTVVSIRNAHLWRINPNSMVLTLTVHTVVGSNPEELQREITGFVSRTLGPNTIATIQVESSDFLLQSEGVVATEYLIGPSRPISALLPSTIPKSPNPPVNKRNQTMMASNRVSDLEIV